MPFIEQNAEPQIRAPSYTPPQNPLRPDFSETMGAAFLQHNPTVNLFRSQLADTFPAEDGHSPLDVVRGSKYEQQYLDRFIESRSTAETRSIMAKIDGEEHDRSTLEAAGWGGTVASIAAGTIDPTIALPAGQIVRNARGAYSLVRSGVSTGVAGGAQIGVQEAILQGTQSTRSSLESTTAIGSGVVLAGLIGGGAAALLSRGERVTLTRALDRVRKEIDDHANPAEPPTLRPATEPTAEIGRPEPVSAQTMAEINRRFDELSSRVSAVPPEPAAPAAAERITGPAYRAPDGQIFTGPIHSDAFAAAQKAGFQGAHDHTADGFVTSTGRFVGREEALQVARGAGQKANQAGIQWTGGNTAVAKRAGTWASADHDIPVTILDKPALKGNDGRMYQQVEFEGKPSFVPVDELRERVSGEAAAEGGSALPQSGGAAAADTRKLEMVPYGLAWTSRVSPTRYVVESSSIPARRIMADTASMPYRFKENVAAEGQAPIATSHGTPIDIQARMDIDGSKVRLHDELGQLYADYRFGDPGATAPRVRGGLDRILGRDEGLMTYKEFSEQVTWATLHNDQHAIPQVAQAAQFVRREIYNKWLGRAQDIHLFGPDVEVKTAESYGQRVMNKEAIRADLKGFVDVQAGWYATEQATKRRAQDRIFNLIEQRNGVSETIEKAASEDAIATARRQYDAIQTKIEREIAGWEGTSVKSAQKAIKEAYEAAEARAIKAAEKLGAGVEKPKVSRTQKLNDAIDKAVEKILKADHELTTEELRNRAQETADRYLGTPDGRLPYDVDSGGPGIGWRPDRDPPRGPLASRVNNIPDVNLWKYMERDIEHVAATHLRTIVPDVLLTERHGDVHMTDQLKQVLNDYNSRIEAATSQKAKDALTREKEGVMERIVGVRDRIRNVFDWSATGEKMGRVANVAKQFTNITTGGMFALASLADFAGSIFRSTLNGTLRDGWVPYLKGVMNLDEGAFKKFTHELRAMSIGTDVTNNSMRGLDDAMDMYRPQTRFERTLAWANDKFFIANFLAPMTDMQKQVAAHPIASNIIRYSKAASEGKATSEQLTSLASAGIDMNMAGKIWQNFSENGGEIKNGVYLPNTADWKGRDAADAFKGALYRDVNIAVVTPGQEKPLFLSTQVGSILGLYKTFTAAATERILIANLQKRDASTLQGLVAAVGLGMLSYKLNSMLGGQKTSDRPQDWIKEGVSRSGVGGWFEEANALASKSTRGGVDIYRMLGADKPLSRYASRSTLDQLLGPTAGKVEALLKVTGAAGSKLTGAKDNDWTAGDTAAVRKLTALQNMIYFRGLVNQLEEGLNGRLGIETKH